ncbi:contractile injection system protein, VgrG/Pvc8 family [Caviibacter abscessus]|uniref:contractile injection system protein, VgrG/Pvc8 family n=1 Tax=Caviibacter abscessus TaxID=1766719 RepID=UPI000829940D|nr:hypothetical protein [Caviibacter abscessus]
MKILIDGKPLNGYKIQEFNILSTLNTHSKLIIKFKISKIESLFNKTIEIIKDKKIFKGKITFFEQTGYEDIEIVAYSLTYELDKITNFRIYQDEDVSYKQIIDEIMKEYNLRYTVSQKLNKKIGRMYVQYMETDFEFIKRILSNEKEVILSTYEGIILFGMQNLVNSNIKNILNKGHIVENDCEYVTFYTKDEAYITGDKISSLHIIKSEISMEKNIVINKLYCCSKYFTKQKYISKLQGLHLEARVVEVIADKNIAKMKVDFSNVLGFKDKSKNKKKIPFTTFYSKTNTGFFPTPEVNDNVDVYFPTYNEEDIKIGLSINNEESGRFCDYNKRNFGNKNILIELTDNRFFIDSSEIVLQTKKDFNVVSGQNFKLDVNDSYTQYSKKIIQVSKNGDIEINSKKNILLKALKIHNN